MAAHQRHQPDSRQTHRHTRPKSTSMGQTRSGVLVEAAGGVRGADLTPHHLKTRVGHESPGVVRNH